jgi:hypothetical protein
LELNTPTLQHFRGAAEPVSHLVLTALQLLWLTLRRHTLTLILGQVLVLGLNMPTPEHYLPGPETQLHLAQTVQPSP